MAFLNHGICQMKLVIGHHLLKDLMMVKITNGTLYFSVGWGLVDNKSRPADSRLHTWPSTARSSGVSGTHAVPLVVHGKLLKSTHKSRGVPYPLDVTVPIDRSKKDQSAVIGSKVQLD